MTFANWLQKELQKRGWSQTELSQRTGIPQGHISRIIKGTRHAGPEPCIAIAEALSLPREEVFRARGWLVYESEKYDLKLSPETARVIFEIENLSPSSRRIVLQVAQATANALRQESEAF